MRGWLPTALEYMAPAGGVICQKDWLLNSYICEPGDVERTDLAIYQLLPPGLSLRLTADRFARKCQGACDQKYKIFSVLRKIYFAARERNKAQKVYESQRNADKRRYGKKYSQARVGSNPGQENLLPESDKGELRRN